MTFLLPLELADPEVRPRASASGKGGESKRDTFHQLLHSDGDADNGS